MNYAIIAAGEGSRLTQEGFPHVKPLVRVGNEYLIERLIRIFRANQATAISIIINQHSAELEQWLQAQHFGVEINLIVQSTPSSLHSFGLILSQGSFQECCLTTVDTIFDEEEFARYIRTFQQHPEVDALMACTQYIDDEKPLYLQVDSRERVTAFADDNLSGLSNRVSAGIYCLRHKALQQAAKAIAAGCCRMRNYQRSLIEAGLNVQAYLMGKVIDIDHVADIAKAEAMLSTHPTVPHRAAHAPKLMLALLRDPLFSPGSQEKDAAILHATAALLQQAGYHVDFHSEADFLSQHLCCQAPYPYVLSMARNPRVLGQLMLWQQRGHTVVVNDPHACYQCYRAQQTKALQAAGISIPRSLIVSTAHYDLTAVPWLHDGNFWVKRGDFQTIEPIDVIRTSSRQQATAILANYHQRGITQAVLMEHIDGDVVKFYGVSHSAAAPDAPHWFHHCYPKVDKFGQPVNTTVAYNAFSLTALQREVERAARLLGLDIYGGDAIVDHQGHFFLIDMNDFPSFSACRDEAARHIALHFFRTTEPAQSQTTHIDAPKRRAETVAVESTTL